MKEPNKDFARFYSKTYISAKELEQEGISEIAINSMVRGMADNLIIRRQDIPIKFITKLNNKTGDMEIKMSVCLISIKEYNRLKEIERKEVD